MSNKNSPLHTFGALKEAVKYYLEKRLDKATLDMAKQSSQITSSLITSLALMGLAMVLYVFVMITIGLFLGSYFGAYGYGFAAVCVMIAFSIAGVYIFRNRLITIPVVDQILTQVNYDHVNNMEELEIEYRKLELKEKMAEEMIVTEISKLPNQAYAQLLNKQVLSSQLATLSAYSIQVAADQFVKAQSKKVAYQEWWRPFVPILVDFATDYLKEYLSGLQLDENTYSPSPRNKVSAATVKPATGSKPKTSTVPFNNVSITELVDN